MERIIVSSLIQTVQVVEAVQSVLIADAKSRIPKQLKGIVTFFSEHNLWYFQAILDEKVSKGCNHHNGNVFPGTNLRFIWPYLTILNENLIGGPEPGGKGLEHPNCRCRLHRLLPLELPKETFPLNIQEELMETSTVTKFFKKLASSKPLKEPLRRLRKEVNLTNIILYELLMRNFVYQLSLQQKVEELLKQYNRGTIERKEVIAGLEQILLKVSDQQFEAEIRKLIKKIRGTLI